MHKDGGVRAFLGLGSNLGDRWRYLREAVAGLPDVAAVSPVYETAPVAGPEGQGPYLNLVAELDTDLTPRRLLEVARRLEEGAGRVRAERWGPRTLGATRPVPPPPVSTSWSSPRPTPPSPGWRRPSSLCRRPSSPTWPDLSASTCSSRTPGGRPSTRWSPSPIPTSVHSASGGRGS